MKYSRIEIVDAVQWFKNGDHPEDYAYDQYRLEDGLLKLFTGQFRKEQNWEGSVVRYYRHPQVPGSHVCSVCKQCMHDHGLIDSTMVNNEDGLVVCPGSYVITDSNGMLSVKSKEVFESEYKEIK